MNYIARQSKLNQVHRILQSQLSVPEKVTWLSLKGLAKAEVLSYIVPGMQVATD